MNFHFGRVSLLPETRLHRDPVFDVVMIGHPDKDADLDYLFSNTAMLNDIRAAGYSEALDELARQRMQANGNARYHPLYNLPVPLRSLDEFNRLFSIEKILSENTRYVSRLGGNYTWLPSAIADFFQIDVMQIPRRLWIIAVDELLGADAFLTPDAAGYPTSRFDSDSETYALLRALDLPSAGILCLPDFERLHIPQALKHIPKLRLVNPAPAFLPCGTNTDDGISERGPVLRERPDDSVYFAERLQKLLRVIASYRPDLSLLIAFPYDKNMAGELPTLSGDAQEKLKKWQENGEQKLLRHTQLIYPYLQDDNNRLSSPSALLAGKMLASTTAKGSWRSIAGIDLPTVKRPFPALSIKETNQLREQLGLAVIRQTPTGVQLDDERLMVPFIEDLRSTNSGELARFMGWLRRALENFGLNLIFDAEDNALKSEILLRDFFARLYTLGALRGARFEDAFSVSSRRAAEGQVIVDIAIAPALAVDSILVDLRFDNNGIQQLEVRGG